MFNWFSSTFSGSAISSSPTNVPDVQSSSLPIYSSGNDIDHLDSGNEPNNANCGGVINPSTLVYAGLETNSFDGLLSIVSEHARINQFIIRKGRDTHNLTKEDALELFGSEELIPQRGKLHCRTKLCPFTVSYALDKKTKRYVVKDKDFDLGHNHDLLPAIQIEGVTRIKLECELSSREMEWMQDIGPFVTSARLRRMMRPQWPHRDYDKSLLQRVIAKGKKCIFGSDPDSFNNFINKGRALSSSRGIFDQVFDESGRLSEIYIQWPIMIEFAAKYGDFTIVDGTFKVTAYDLVLLIYTNVDSLGKSTMTGLAFAPSENSSATMKGARLFSLGKEGSVLMTDGASAFNLAAETMNVSHVLCVHHYRNCIFASSGGLLADQSSDYKKHCNQAIFNVMSSTSVLEEHLEQMKLDFITSSAQTFIKGLWDDRTKVCATFTAKYFTGGHVATVRGESNNSRLKEHGDLNKDMAKWNLLQIFDHIDSIMKRQHLNAITELRKLITNGCKWSKYVDTQWRAQ
jgi:hypothetical protein